MKASVTVREGQKPLLRAKVPVNLVGLPLFSAISVGNPRELALHLGSYLDAGPSFKVSYKPNDPSSLFTLLLKTGFGVWGSPNGAALAMAAEFNLSSRGSPSFTLRVKPRVGDFSFRKDASSSPIPSIEHSRHSSVGEEDTATSVVGAASPGTSGSKAGARSYDNGFDNGLSPLGLGVGSGLKMREKVRHFGEPTSPGLMVHSPRDESLEREGMVGADTKSGMESARHHLENGDRASASDAFEAGFVGAVADRDAPGDSSLDVNPSWFGENAKSWSLHVHSALPLGRQVMGRVRWGVRVPSDLFQTSGSQGSNFSLLKLPLLVMDKISIESADPYRKLQPTPSFYADDGLLNYGLMEGRTEEGRQLGSIASVCCSIRQQVHLLHSENRLLKDTMEDLKGEIGQFVSTVNKRFPTRPRDILMQEENMLRSQLFGELQEKVSGSNLQTSGSKESNYHKENQGKKWKKGNKEFREMGSDGEMEPGNEYRSKPVANERKKSDSSSEHAVSEELKKAIRNATNQTGTLRME